MRDPMRILIRLVLNWKFLEIVSRFCATLSAIGCMCVYAYVCVTRSTNTSQCMVYGVATISRHLKIMGLFCRISSLSQSSFAKETCHFKEPTNRSHPVPISHRVFLPCPLQAKLVLQKIVSFVGLFYKRDIYLRSLLIEATPYPVCIACSFHVRYKSSWTCHHDMWSWHACVLLWEIDYIAIYLDALLHMIQVCARICMIMYLWMWVCNMCIGMCVSVTRSTKASQWITYPVRIACSSHVHMGWLQLVVSINQKSLM